MNWTDEVGFGLPSLEEYAGDRGLDPHSPATKTQ